MMIIRHAAERGHANYGWLDSYHSFSFANYYDPNYMGFRQLRVINEDRVIGGHGFDTHSHRDMEIITYMVEGALEHRDSMGNRCVIHAGEVQRMTAGTGIAHSEYNASETDAVHLLQIWIFPEFSSLRPSYEQKYYSEAEKHGKLKLIASPDAQENSLKINQNIRIYASILYTGEEVHYSIANHRHTWLQVIKGTLNVNTQVLKPGDGMAASHETVLNIKAQSDAEFLLFDLA